MPEEKDPAVGPLELPEASSFRSGFVALIGRPNVGKSTLLNRLVGSKVSIVSPAPQTTRLVIRAVARSADAEVTYVDTPGVHRARYRMNQEMVRSAREALSGVDLVLLLMAGPDGFSPGDAGLLQLLPASPAPLFLLINKMDAMRRSALLPLMDQVRRRRDWDEIIPCSGLTGENCDDLVRSIHARLPAGPPLFPPDFVTDLPTRLAVGERIREQILLRTREEIPHSTAVLVDRMEESERGEFRIAATIYVDRESQKAILIGREGSMLKAIGMAARQDLATYVGATVHLSLWVKVKNRWRDDAILLRLLGISPGG